MLNKNGVRRHTRFRLLVVMKSNKQRQDFPSPETEKELCTESPGAIFSDELDFVI